MCHTFRHAHAQKYYYTINLLSLLSRKKKKMNQKLCVNGVYNTLFEKNVHKELRGWQTEK